MKPFKFHGGYIQNKTQEELITYSLEYSHPYRFHEVGCLFSKSLYKVLILSPIRNGEITTFEEIERIINENSLTPEEYVRIIGEEDDDI
jgi:hypothetical protein